MANRLSSVSGVGKGGGKRNLKNASYLCVCVTSTGKDTNVHAYIRNVAKKKKKSITDATISIVYMFADESVKGERAFFGKNQIGFWTNQR